MSQFLVVLLWSTAKKIKLKGEASKMASSDVYCLVALDQHHEFLICHFLYKISVQIFKLTQGVVLMFLPC